MDIYIQYLYIIIQFIGSFYFLKRCHLCNSDSRYYGQWSQKHYFKCLDNVRMIITNTCKENQLRNVNTIWWAQRHVTIQKKKKNKKKNKREKKIDNNNKEKKNSFFWSYKLVLMLVFFNQYWICFYVMIFFAIN